MLFTASILFFLLCVMHAIGDFGLQSEYMAVNKNPNAHKYWPVIMLMHCLIHAGGVFLILGGWAYLHGVHAQVLVALAFAVSLLELGAHFTGDFFKCKVENEYSLAEPADQAFHLVCKLAWVLLVCLVYSRLG